MPDFAGPVGLWTSAFEMTPASARPELVAELEEAGWGALWFGEAYGREAFTNAALLLAASTTITVATGIANIYARDPMAMNAAALTLADGYPGRFVCGIGVSHGPLVERTRGHVYSSPLATMRDYLEAMDKAPYMAAAPALRPPRVLAALGPKMLALAAEKTQGAHPYLTVPAHTAQAREILGPAAILAVEQGVVLGDRETFRARAHAHLEIYTGLPNYRNSWLRQGFDADDLVRGGSDRLADALVAHGDEEAVVARVREHLDAGASHVCLQVLGADPFGVPREDWARLASALAAAGLDSTGAHGG